MPNHKSYANKYRHGQKERVNFEKCLGISGEGIKIIYQNPVIPEDEKLEHPNNTKNKKVVDVSKLPLSFFVNGVAVEYNGKNVGNFKL